MKARYRFLIQRHKNNIYSYALYMLKNRMDADDVTQEALIRIWKNEEKFNILAARTWIMKTTHNLCIDCLRKRNAALNREFSLDGEYGEIIADANDENDPYKKSESQILTGRIKESIEALPENLKSVFVLFEMQGMKYREISDILNMPINSVKVYLMRARVQLQEALKQYAPHGERR